MIDNELKYKIYAVHYVCQVCGETYGQGFADGKKQFIVSTWHTDICDICEKESSVTEFRDFGYAKNL